MQRFKRMDAEMACGSLALMSYFMSLWPFAPYLLVFRGSATQLGLLV